MLFAVLKNLVIRKFRASTLVETIVAMLIVTIAFSLALMLMVNISKSSNNSLKTKAYFLANNIWVQTKAEKTYLDQEFIYGNVVIKKTITAHDQIEELFWLNVSAYDDRNHLLFEQNELVIIEKKLNI